MAIFQWTDKYSVNNKIIDSQHKKLVDMINELHTAMSMGKGKELLEPILNDLIFYTKSHFKTEEQMMQKAKYAGYEEHKMEHDQFTNKVMDLSKRYKEGKTVLTIEVMNFLKDWLINHIEVSDKKYKEVI